MKIEYKVLKTKSPTADAAQLNAEFGSEGWQLIEIYEWCGNWHYVFSRAKPYESSAGHYA